MKRLAALLLAALLPAPDAHAIMGGREDQGPLARSSVMVLSSKGGMCSAVVVAPDVVLTAAHCVTGADAFRVHFRGDNGAPVLIAPAAVAVHPGYDPRAIEARRRSIDLAILRLPAPLPARFGEATLTAAAPRRGSKVDVGGWGLAREGDPRSTGTFRTAPLFVTEPFGPSAILLWMEGAASGACEGDSGGPVAAGERVVAVTTWAKGSGRATCGRVTQAVLVGAQRSWIDGVLGGWRRAARWDAAAP